MGGRPRKSRTCCGRRLPRERAVLTPTGFRQDRPECGRVGRCRWRPRYFCRWIGPHLLNRPREVPENSATRGSRPRGIPSVSWRRRRRASAQQRVRHPVWPSLRPHEPARGRKLIVHRILSLLRTWITGNQPCELGHRLRRANMRGPRSCRALWRAGPAARYGARISEGPFGSSWLSPGQAKRPCGTGWGHRVPSTCSELANCREVLE